MGRLLIRRKLETILECDEGIDEESVASSSLMTQSCQPPRSKKRRLLPLLATSIPAKDTTFHDFRTATIEKYPSFSFLGPASMAVYWCKLYLKTDKFRWIHYCSPPPSDLRKRSLFWHIPGQYLTDPLEPHDDAQWRRRVGDVLSRGEPGVHYATSYVGIYNLLRMYGRYGLNSDGDVVLLSYHGPDLPPPTLTTTSS